MFQFPLHRDPRCNEATLLCAQYVEKVSVPFTSGSSLQPVTVPLRRKVPVSMFQFPLHRDPRCNQSGLLLHCQVPTVSVPFTSGSSLQPYRAEGGAGGMRRFSSLYIGILAATLGEGLLFCLTFCFSSLYIGILAATGASGMDRQ